MKYLDYLEKKDDITTTEGESVEVFELKGGMDSETLEEWAISYRQNYCGDDILDLLVKGTGLTKEEYIALICDHDFGYSTSIIINSICEILVENETKGNPCGDAVERLQKLSQNLKYGLSESTEIFLYELGFNDRVLAQEIAKEVGYCSKKKDVRTAIRSKKEEIEKVLVNYPSVFRKRLSAM